MNALRLEKGMVRSNMLKIRGELHSDLHKVITMDRMLFVRLRILGLREVAAIDPISIVMIQVCVKVGPYRRTNEAS